MAAKRDGNNLATEDRGDGGFSSAFHRRRVIRICRLLCWKLAAALGIVGWVLKGFGEACPDDPKTGVVDAPKLKLPIGLFTAAAAALKLNPPAAGELTPAAPPLPKANDDVPDGVGLDTTLPKLIFAGEPPSELKAKSTVRLA